MADAAVATKVRKPRVDYGISNGEFITIWNASESPKQAAEKLSNATRTVSIDYVSARAANMRKDGFVLLKSFRGTGAGGRPARTVDVVGEQVAILAQAKNIQQGTPEYEALKAELQTKVDLATKEREENAAKRKAAKDAKKAEAAAA
jgi:hypothetical protein